MRRVTSIVAPLALTLLCGVAGSAHAQVPADSTHSPAPAPADSVIFEASDSLRAVVAKDSLGMTGTLRGSAPEQDPATIKATLQRMGSREVEGMTEWERKKNPRVAMLCSMVLPGLGQTYNGRRLKVGLMVGFASYYMGTMVLNYKKFEAAEARRDTFAPGSDEFQFENNLAAFYKEEARTYLWWSGAVWLIGILDSWIDAHLYDVRAYTPPTVETSLPRSVNERTGYLTVGFGLEFAH